MPKNRKNAQFDEDSFSENDDFPFEDDEDNDFSDEDQVEKQNGSTTAKVDKPKLSKHILKLQESLGLGEFKKQIEIKKETEMSQKKAAEVVKSGPLVVVYEDPRKRKKVEKSIPTLNKKTKLTDKEVDQPPEFDLIQAKHDIKKLAISALKTTSKEEAQAQLAISLGALPPKAKCINYKDLKANQQMEKNNLAKRMASEEVFIQRVSGMNKRVKSTKDKNKVAGFDSSFGKFRPGLKKKLSTINGGSKK